MEDPLIETWRIHDRIHRYLLTAISDDSLSAAITPKFRNVSKLFAHIHNVRLMWLQSAAPDLLEGLSKLEAAVESREALEASLTKSGEAIATLIARSRATGDRVKGFKPHVHAFVGYLIAHEAHHRGQIGWTLKAAGTPLDKKTAFGLWEWGVR
ncbi:MAG: DinB family protein [Isosphaeraceae bacterium]|nr:DinB family protein [Isosphaeraceae bacterium]